MRKETQEKLKEVLVYKIESEGFDYCFDGYSDWKEIEDPEFHVLREHYLKSKNELTKYIEENFGEVDE